MFDAAVTWMLGHPLQGVACLVGFAVVVGLVAIEGLHHVTEHGHPRT